MAGNGHGENGQENTVPGNTVGAVMVVGGGIAGMQASLDMAEAGYRVYLVEQKSAIGGHMAQLDKTFPTNDCAMCILSPRMLEISRHPLITIQTSTQAIEVRGRAGDFQVLLSRRPPFVDVGKCTGCSDCVRVCPQRNGLLLLPYFEGERTPNVPAGTGVWFGVNQKTFDPGHFARAAMEGVTLGMNYGLRRLAELGVKPTQIRATGGGANSKVWRQIMADVFEAEVVTLKVGEGAAYGAALQAFWCWRLQQGEKLTIEEVTDRFVGLNQTETAQPDAANVKVYRELQALQDEMSLSLRGVFARHRQFVLR